MEVIVPVGLPRIMAEPRKVPGSKVARPRLQTLFGTSSIIINSQRNDTQMRKFIQIRPSLEQKRDQTGVTMKSSDETAALARCVEQPLNTLVQFIVQRQCEHARFQGIECEGPGDRLDPAIGGCIRVVRKGRLRRG
jgi:hypothetical protein